MFDSVNNDFCIVVVWKVHNEAGETYKSHFSANTNQWSPVSLFEYEIQSILYGRGVHIDGKIFWIGLREDDVSYVKRIILSYDARLNLSARHNIGIDEQADPEHIFAVDGRLAIVFRRIMTDHVVSSFLWLSGSQFFPINEENYTFVKQIDDMC